MKTHIINFDFLGSCRGTCPSCTLSEAERTSPYPFLTGEQMENALSGIMAEHGVPDRLVMGLGRGNVLALDRGEHAHIFALASRAKALAPRAHRLLELSTSLIEKPQQQWENAQLLAKMCGRIDPDLEMRFVVILDISKTSNGYWDLIGRFIKDMAKRRGGKDGSGDILTLNVSVRNLVDPASVISRIAGWPGPLNLQWLASGEKQFIYEEQVIAGEAWLAEMLALAKRAGLDCNLLNVPQLAGDGAGNAVRDMRSQMSALSWVDRQGAVRSGAFTMLGDYMAGTAISLEQAFVKMMRHQACRGCEHLSLCMRVGGFAPALEVLSVMRPAVNTCPSMLRQSLSMVKDTQTQKGRA